MGGQVPSSAEVRVNAGSPAVAAAVAVTGPFQLPSEELSAFRGERIALGAVFDRCLRWNSESAWVWAGRYSAPGSEAECGGGVCGTTKAR